MRLLSSFSTMAEYLTCPLSGLAIRSSCRSGCWIVVLLMVLLSRRGFADEVILRNGNHITGRVRSLTDGELILKTDAAGELTIDVKKVNTFSSDSALRIRVGTEAPFESRVAAGSDGKVEVRRTPGGPPQLIAILEIAAINPPAPAWTGKVLLNGKISRGDSWTTEGGVDFTLDKEWQADRLHFTGEYAYGRERDNETGLTFTSDDFGNAYGKYDHDIRGALYVDVNAKVLHDQLAELRYRVSPAAGIGYRWFEDTALELFTDVGLAYADERFTSFGGRSFWGPQFEYGIEWKPVKRWTVSNTLEYYPSFSDFAGNYLLDTRGEVQLRMWRHSFLAVTGEYHFDTEPAPSAKKGDYRFGLGPGLKF
jgi:hypothetical protein